MTSSAALDYLLDHPEEAPSPPRPASPVQLIGLGMAEAVEAAALSYAHKNGLMRGSVLHCWHCHKAMPWHVSLICSERCRWLALEEGKEREKRIREREQRERAEAEQSRPQQRSRRFGDDE
jgi:endogenous inhibitor of DNA gyrase (YacG/DUF329 family)